MTTRLHSSTSAPEAHNQARSKVLIALLVVWLLALLVGCLLLIDYDTRPGALGPTPEAWPSATGLVRSTAQPTLVMFIHPRCPCSRASVAELARLMEQRTSPVDVRVLFVQPRATPEDWSRTALWRAAEQIPGVRVAVDHGGEESHVFGAATSGQALLYDAAGQLVFRGGITAGRGHFGANPASEKLLAQINAASPTSGASPVHPVFGCSLLAPDDQCRKPQP